MNIRFIHEWISFCIWTFLGTKWFEDEEGILWGWKRGSIWMWWVCPENVLVDIRGRSQLVRSSCGSACCVSCKAAVVWSFRASSSEPRLRDGFSVGETQPLGNTRLPSAKQHVCTLFSHCEAPRSYEIFEYVLMEETNPLELILNPDCIKGPVRHLLPQILTTTNVDPSDLCLTETTSCSAEMKLYI